MITSILDPEVAPEDRIIGSGDPDIKCVFLTPSETEFRRAEAILRATPISLHHAATLEQAEFQLARIEAGVLMTELQFPDGDWEDAIEMLSHSYPRVLLVLAAAQADERLWIRALERGAFDLVSKPFQTEELRRILENADAHSKMLGSGEARVSQEPPADPGGSSAGSG